MIKIKKESKFTVSIIIILCALIAITLVYPKYSAIWDVAFLISIFYTSTQTILDTSKKSKRKLNINIVIIIIFATIIAFYEMSIGNPLIFSTALLILTNLLDSTLNKKSN